MTRLLLQAGVIAASYALPTPPPPTTLPEAEWLMTCVASDGAIRQTPGDTYVLPYMSNYACLGLVRAYEVSSNAVYLNAAKSWCLWYAGQMDPSTGYAKDVRSSSGTATDWTPSTSGLSADSTDAYAGMFLTALWMTFYHDPGSGWIDPITGSIALALTAIESTQQPDGLTWALPTYTVKYLEDNIETLIGLQCASALAYALGETAVKARADVDRTAMSSGFGLLWNYETNTWDWALHENDGFQANDWSDAGSRQQQSWALGWGAMPPGLGAGQSLYDAYDAAQPDWDTTRDVILPSWALELLGDSAAQATANSNLQATIDGVGHAYPYTCGTSGQFIIALYGRSGLPTAEVTFPDGVNLLANPDFALDSNSDGTADGVGNYGSPTMSLIPSSPSPSKIQQMVTPGGMDMRVGPVAVVPGALYVFSFYRKITASDSGCRAVVKIEFPGTPSYYYTVADPGITDGDFVRWWQIGRAPADATTALCEIGTDGSGGMTMQVKAMKLEAAGCSPTPFAYPPLLPFADAFTRGDGGIGNGWDATYATMVIISDTARAGGHYATVTREVGLADQDISGHFHQVSGETVYLVGRQVDVDHGIKASVNRGLLSIISASTIISTMSVSRADDFSARLVLVGNTYAAYVDGALVTSGTLPSDAPAGTRCGFQVDDPAQADYCDDFAVAAAS